MSYPTKAMPSIPQLVKSCRILGLTDNFEPTARIADRIGIGLDETIACLRTSQDETAMVICALYDRLNPPQRKSIDIDYLIAAAHSQNPYKVAGLICETYCQVKSIETMMTAARESPKIMESSTKHAKKMKGFQHAKMVLQTTGVAPVPVNQKNVIIGNKIDNSRNLNINVPTHGTVVDEVSEILGKLNVSSNGDPEEDRGDRESQEDKSPRKLSG